MGLSFSVMRLASESTLRPQARESTFKPFLTASTFILCIRTSLRASHTALKPSLSLTPETFRGIYFSSISAIAESVTWYLITCCILFPFVNVILLNSVLVRFGLPTRLLKRKSCPSQQDYTRRPWQTFQRHPTLLVYLIQPLHLR